MNAPDGPRIEAVDVLRGLVMVVMVLDHLRDYLMAPSPDPTDLAHASPALFLTRWATHFCAPTFALLAGVGARLAAERDSSQRPRAAALATRGLWLILLEQTVVKFGILFRFDPGLFLGLVLWSIGGSFVILAGLTALKTPAWVIGIVGAAVIFGHDAFDMIPAGSGTPLRPLAAFLLRPSAFRLSPGISGLVGYPLLPWFGVVALGYWLGGAYALDRGRRRATFAAIGLASVGLFAALRASGCYGEPSPWRPGANVASTVLAFVNCTKYPPSLQFLLMTIGPALVALAALDAGLARWGRPLSTLGRVPLAFYLLQWYVAHGMAWALAAGRGEPTGWLFVDGFPIVPPASSAYGLPALYVGWLVALLTLYPVCARYARFKARRRGSRWLSYL